MDLHIPFLVLLLITSPVFLAVSTRAFTKEIKVYPKPLHQGRQRIVEVPDFPGCVNFTDTGNGNNVMSVDTMRGCFTLYEEPRCLGGHVDIKQTTPAHWNIDLGFGDRTRSISQCGDCATLLKKWKFPKSSTISLYLGKDFTGEVLELMNLHTDGCQELPENFINKVMSAKPDGNCYEIHKGRDCTGEALELSPVTKSLLHDLRDLHFNTRTASISLCHWECWNQTYTEELKAMMMSEMDSYTANHTQTSNAGTYVLVTFLVIFIVSIILLVGLLYRRRLISTSAGSRESNDLTFFILHDNMSEY